MASYRHHLDDEEKPSTEDEKEAPEEYADREKDMSEREKDSLSELEDDDKYNKSDTDNDSDPGRADRKEQKLNNLKVSPQRPPRRPWMSAVPGLASGH